MKIRINSCYSLLLSLLPLSLLSYTTIRIFNAVLIILVLTDFGLTWLYSPDTQALAIRKSLIPFLFSSVVLISFLVIHVLTLPVYTLVTTFGIALRVLAIVLFTLLGKNQYFCSNVQIYRFGLISSCFLSVFNDRLNLFSASVNSNSLSITIVSFYFMYAVTAAGKDLRKHNLSIGCILLSFFGLALCSSRSTFVGLISSATIIGLGLLIRLFWTASIKKKAILGFFGGLLMILLLFGSFLAWKGVGSEYATNRFNTLLTFKAQPGTGDTTRLVLMANAFNYGVKAPLVGHGSGFTKSISFTNDPKDIVRSIHNTYLTIFVDYGLIGLILFIGWVVIYLNLPSFVRLDFRHLFVVYMFIVATFTDIIATPIFMVSLLFLSPGVREK